MKFIVFVFLFLFFILPGYSQKRLHPYLGLHVSMDAGGYFVAPSFMAGADYLLRDKISASSYVHVFRGRLYDVYPDGSIDKGKYQSYILALLIQRHLSKSPTKGMDLAGGAAVQRTINDYIINNEAGIEKRTILVAAVRVGYKFPVKQRNLTVELNAVGPHIGKVGPPPYYEQVIEILTQLSFGFRFIF
jgi:hypothetical protein